MNIAGTSIKISNFLMGSPLLIYHFDRTINFLLNVKKEVSGIMWFDLYCIIYSIYDNFIFKKLSIYLYTMYVKNDEVRL